MTRLLKFGEDEVALIRGAVARAKEKPITLDMVRALAIADQDKQVVELADRQDPEGRDVRPMSEHVLLPVGFHLAISFEQQPAGMCLHLSLSVDTPNRIPNQVAASMIFEAALRAAGYHGQEPPEGRMWLEEYLEAGQPGGKAVNMLYLIEPAEDRQTAH